MIILQEQQIKRRIRNKLQSASCILALEYSRERRSANAKKQARATNGRFGSGSGGNPSASKKNKGVTGEVKKKSKKSSGDEEHNPNVAKIIATELAVGHVVDKLRHNKQFKAAIIQGKRALLRARPTQLKGALKGVGAAAGRTLNQPVKETAKVVAKKSFKILMKTGKFSAKYAIKAAPFLLKSAAAIGVAAANLPNAPLWAIVAAGVVAYASYRAVKYLRKRYHEKQEKQKLKRVIESINEDKFWQQYETYRKKNRLTDLQHA